MGIQLTTENLDGIYPPLVTPFDEKDEVDYELFCKEIEFHLKYDIKGNAVITAIERVSRPGRRVYVNQNQLPRVLDGLGISILSTSKGVLSNKVAKRFGVGGEVICNVW